MHAALFKLFHVNKTFWPPVDYIIKLQNSRGELLDIFNVTVSDHFVISPIVSNESDSLSGGNSTVQETYIPPVTISRTSGGSAAPIFGYCLLIFFMLFGLCLFLAYIRHHVHTVWVCGDNVAADETCKCCEREEDFIV